MRLSYVIKYENLNEKYYFSTHIIVMKTVIKLILKDNYFVKFASYRNKGK